MLSYRLVFGARIRDLREQCGWSQTMTAQKIPLSQKHLSRLELGNINALDRHLLIRLAEIFYTPLATGELNQWLHAFGYRPHVLPGLPLPPNHAALVQHCAPAPAVILDVGRYIRYLNDSMERLYDVRLCDLTGLQQNWLWQYFHPQGFLSHAYPCDSRIRILNRLFWDWEPYYLEPWNQSLLHQLEESLNMSWDKIREYYRIPTDPLASVVSETLTVRSASGDILRFRTHLAEVPFRPDLLTIVYRPDNPLAVQWCTINIETL